MIDGKSSTIDGRGSSEPSTFSAVRVGETIAGRYRVTREIGAGGMGQVLEVEHVELEKRFALKLVRPDRWDATLDARFRREARALARVTTPRVPQITDFGVDPGCGPFYVMELVDGVPLDELLRREGPLPRERALELAIGVAEALVDVHAAGIVHRDVKPSNVGVCSSGPVKVRLLDFGLATGVDDRFASRITESRTLVGSLPYMAPEQFHGERAGVRVDVWALGVILYEMLAGALPFDAPSTAALMHQILYAPVPSHPAPRTCSAVLARLLAKDPEERPASAADAIALLERALARPSGEPEVAELAERATAPAGESSPRMSVSVTPELPMGRDAKLIALGIALALAGLVAWAASFLVTSPDPVSEPAATPEPVPAPEPERPPEPVPVPEPVPEPESETEAATESEPTAPATARRGERSPARTPVETVPPPSEPPPPSEEPGEPGSTWDGTIIETPSP